MIYQWKLLMLFAFFLTIICHDSIAKANESDSSYYSKKLMLFPIGFYTPETRIGFGIIGGSILTPRDTLNGKRASTIQTGVIYTQNKQILASIFWRGYWGQEKWLTAGEIGYFDYIYRFFGIGNDKSTGIDEWFTMRYPRFRFQLMRETYPNLHGGITYWFDHLTITSKDTTGELIKNEITGSNGGIISELGLVINYDTRKRVLYPNQGWFIESSFVLNGKLTGSKFSYNRFLIDIARFYQLPWQHIIAFNGFGDFVTGDPHFTRLAMLGGPKKMRGLFQGRYRDKKLVLLQAEYRTWLFWKLGATAFASWGGVAEKFSNFQLEHFQYTVGGGIRVKLDESGLNVRIDAAFGKRTQGFYITFGEAF